MRLSRLSAAAAALLLTACNAYPAGMAPEGGLTGPIAGAIAAAKAKGTLLGEVRSPIVAAGGLNLVARGGGHVLEANGRKMVAAGGGNVVGNAGANIVAAGGMNESSKQGGIVAAGGLNFRLAQAEAPATEQPVVQAEPTAAPTAQPVVQDDLAEAPVAGATVFLRDAMTLAVVPEVAPTTTDETGAFTFTDVPLDGTYVVEAVGLGATGEGVRLAAVARAAATDGPKSPVAVTVASTLVAARVAETTDERRGGVYALEPGAVADAVHAVQEQLKADRIELRAAAEGMRVKTTGKVEDAAVAADYQPAEFARSAGASARMEDKKDETRARVGKVRKAIDPTIDVPDVTAAAGGGSKGGKGGGSDDGPKAGASAAPATDASAAPTAEASAGLGKAPGKEPAAGGTTTDGGTTTGGGSTSGGSTSGGGKSSGGSGGGSKGGGKK